MTPSFEREREIFQPLVLQANKDRALERRRKIETYYMSQLREDCRRNLDRLYEANKGGGKVVALDKTLEDLGELSGRETKSRLKGRGCSWKVLRNLREEAISEIVDYSPTENPEYLHYSPFAIHYFSASEVLYLAIKVDSSNAGKYLGTLYATTLNEKDHMLGGPDEWLPVHGDVQVARTYGSFREESELDPSLIIDCDITDTKFGKDYKEAKEKR